MKSIGNAYDECKALSMKCMRSLLGDGDEGDGEKAIKAALAIKAAALRLEADLFDLTTTTSR